MALPKYADSDSDSGPPQSSHSRRQTSSQQRQSPAPSSNRSHHSHSQNSHPSHHSHSHPSQQSQQSHQSQPYQQPQQQQPLNNNNNNNNNNKIVQIPDYNYSDSDQDNDTNNNINNNQARSTVFGSNPSSNTWTVMQRHQRQQQQQQHVQQENYSNDCRSMVPLSTVAPPRQQYNIAQRPHFAHEFPPSHARQITLTINAIQARPVIHGILHRYNVRFHAHSDDPKDADIPQDNRARRYEIIMRELFQQIRQIYGKFDFDNTVIYCDRKVLQTQQFGYKINAMTYGNGTVRISYNAELDFDSMDAIRAFSHEYLSQIVHVMHRNKMRKVGYVTFGKSHYIDPELIHSLNIREYPYLEAMHGFFSTMEYTKERQTIIYFRNKLRLKEKRKIMDIMNGHYDAAHEYQFEHDDHKSSMYETECRKELIGRYFITLYARRCIRKISAINFNKSLDSKFKCKGNWVTFRDYYKNIYKEDLVQPFHGLLAVESKYRGKLRTDYYPPELCYLTGYPAKLRRNKKITGIIARNTSIPLQKRLENVDKVIKKLNQLNQYQSRERQVLNDPNVVGHTRTLEYGANLLNVTAHRIVPTTILYNSIRENGLAIINDHQLLRSIKDVRPFSSCARGSNNRTHIVKWGVAYLDCREQSYELCHEELCRAFSEFSHNWFSNVNNNDMNLCLDPYPFPIEIKSPMPNGDNMDLYLRNIIKYVQDGILRYKLEGLLFILPSARDDGVVTDVYNTVKALCNVKTGTITQCIRAATICPGRENDPKVRSKKYNSLLGTFRQFMVKLGVIPWKVMLTNINEVNDNNVGNQNNPKLNYLVDGKIDLNIPTMIIGIDVNHNRQRGVSTIGFVSTYDADFCRVMAQIDYQQMGQEVVGIKQLQMLTEKAIANFVNKRQVIPEQIFVYRDGVSLGELNAVAKLELIAIRRAAHQSTRIQFMIVQKRVNARFFEWDHRQNVLVGAKPRTIVDSEIVSTEMWDFYLIACGAPRDKVANPVRVIIINDDLKLSEQNSKNDIELFTYALCNIYFGWAGPVKIPHVIKYADKVAEQYSNLVDYMDIINIDKANNKPNTITGLNLSHHYL